MKAGKQFRPANELERAQKWIMPQPDISSTGLAMAGHRTEKAELDPPLRCSRSLVWGTSFHCSRYQIPLISSYIQGLRTKDTLFSSVFLRKRTVFPQALVAPEEKMVPERLAQVQHQVQWMIQSQQWSIG